jgi:metal transporter CNNM
MFMSEEETVIQTALDVLRSSGVENLSFLCHSTRLIPGIPICNDTDVFTTTMSTVTNIHSGLRMSSRMLEGTPVFSSTVEEDEYFVSNIIGVLIMLCVMALISGLFLGLLTLDALDLEIIQRSSIDEDERDYATAILPVVQDRHLLLVTLLTMNALAYETLPLFLDRLVPSWAAVLMSVTLILVFGEIVPSGIFTGPNQLYLGSKMAPLMLFFLRLFYPIASPLARILDYLTDEGGDDHHQDETYNRGELSALVRIQHEKRTTSKLYTVRQARTKKFKEQQRNYTQQQTWSALKTEIMERVNERYDDDETTSAAVEQLTPPLDPREVDIIEGALRMKTRLAMDVYTPLSHVYAVAGSVILDQSTISTIYGKGYSRIPVYRPNPKDPKDTTAILGFLMTRQLMLIDWDDNREVSSLPLQVPECVSPRMNLIDLLRILQTGGQLMAFVCARPDVANLALEINSCLPPEAGFMGIVTLEDIMESLLQDRIYDESDIRDRDRAVATLQSWAATQLQSFVRNKRRKLQLQNQNSMGEDESTPLLEDEPPYKGYSTRRTNGRSKDMTR